MPKRAAMPKRMGTVDEDVWVQALARGDLLWFGGVDGYLRRFTRLLWEHFILEGEDGWHAANRRLALESRLETLKGFIVEAVAEAVAREGE